MIYTLGLKNIPFQRDRHQIIYVEGKYDKRVNQYIQENYAAIKQHFSSRGFDFIYLPFLTEELKADGSLNYFAPYLTKGKLELKSDLILQWMAHPENRDKIPPSLIYYDPNINFPDYPDANYLYREVSLQGCYYDDTNNLSYYLRIIIKDIINKGEDSGIRFREEFESEEQAKKFRDKEIAEEFRCYKELEEKRDESRKIQYDIISEEELGGYQCSEPTVEQYDEETLHMLEVMKEYAHKLLYEKGIRSYVLHQVVEDKPKISKLRITKDGRIFLPDYNNKEIQMTPIHKAVYFLYLKHPEGIAFKLLQDYRGELIMLYKKVKPSYTHDDERRIDDLIDPFNNSINEKCSRIRASFIKEFDEHLAQYYYIRGTRGEARYISLPRKLVEWEK